MKSMTCRQLGGPCDLAHHGDDANEIIQAQDRHLREAVAAGSSDHEPALKEMKGRGSGRSRVSSGIAKCSATSLRCPAGR